VPSASSIVNNTLIPKVLNNIDARSTVTIFKRDNDLVDHHQTISTKIVVYLLKNNLVEYNLDWSLVTSIDHFEYNVRLLSDLISLYGIDELLKILTEIFNLNKDVLLDYQKGRNINDPFTVEERISEYIDIGLGFTSRTRLLYFDFLPFDATSGDYSELYGFEDN